MPVIKQAIKKVRQDKRKASINLVVRTKYKKAINAFKKSQTPALLSAAFKALDRAAKTNVIHRNKAARLKSRLSKKLAGGAKSTAPVSKSSSKKK